MSDKDWLVYLHINKINHKVYVGITHYVNNPNTRWKNGIGYRDTSIIYKAVLKYGWDNFSHIIFCKTDKETACLLERNLIHYYKSKGTSYNIGLGGEGSESFSEETRNKLKQYTPWIKGKKHSKESIERIREASRRPCSEDTKRKIGIANSGSRNGMFGKIPSKEAVQAIILRFSKPVVQLDKYNNVMGEFSSASSAERHLGVKGNHISCCCIGKRKTAYGYKWKYKYE